MQTNQILSANLLDLLFDNRNKEYGAYELRNTYQRRITKAMLVTGGITLMIFAGSVLAKNHKPIIRSRYEQRTVDLSKIDDKQPDVIKPKKIEVQPPVKTVKFVPFVIKDDKDVKEPPPTKEEIVDSKIGVVNIEGKIDDGTSQQTPPDDGKGIFDSKKNDDPNDLWPGPVEIDAKFTGNWQRFLEKNLNPEVPVENGAPAGNHTVEIQFVVDIEGNVSDIKALTNLGYGMEQEAVRVLKKATKWEPAIQNGRKVKAYRRQRITFQVLNND